MAIARRPGRARVTRETLQNQIGPVFPLGRPNLFSISSRNENRVGAERPGAPGNGVAQRCAAAQFHGRARITSERLIIPLRPELGSGKRRLKTRCYNFRANHAPSHRHE